MGGVCGIGSIKGRLSPIGSLQGALSIPVGGGLDCDIYEGEYNITPSDTVQVLPTTNKLLKHDIVIEASSGGLPEGSEMATDDDIDGLIDDVFGTGVNPDPDEPTYSPDDIATEKELNDAITDLKTLIDGKAAQATVDTLVGEDTGKSVRTISSEEVAKIVAGADKSYDTLKEIADWILSDTTGAAKMANDITRLDGILAGIGGTDEEATVVAYVTKMINALGIGDYVKTTTMTTELGKKVDKVEGSRLMTNAEGTKLAGIAAGAQANVIEKIKVNGVEVTPAAEDKSIALTIPTGKLAGKDIVAETDLDAALKEKVNAAAEGNHSHANKAFLDTLSGATDEEVTAMCTEVFGA